MRFTLVPQKKFLCVFKIDNFYVNTGSQMELHMNTRKNNTSTDRIPLSASPPDQYPQIPSIVRHPLI